MSRFEFLNWRTSDPGTRPRMKKRVWVLLLGGGLIAVLFVLQGFTTYVRPYECAVRESRYGGGIDQTPVYGPTFLFTGPGVTYHRFPFVVQTLTMSSTSQEASTEQSDTRNMRALEIDSSDGSKIRIDASILYRVLDPYKVITRIGPGRLFEDNAIIPKVTLALKENMGKLKAEDFYSEVLRVRATEAAKQALNIQLKELGMSVDHVLIRQYYYLPDYQHQIEERKVQDQLVFTNQSMGESAKMEAARRKIDAEGQAAVNVEKQRGAAEVTKIRAEADLYSRKARAEGDLLVSLAEAQGTELENAAYRVGQGSDNLVGLEMAEVLEGIDVIFVQSGRNGVNFMDLNQTLNMFDVK